MTPPPWPAPLTHDERARVSAAWSLDPSVAYLNHGSFGACPRGVLEVQAELRARLERHPVRFLAEELEARLDAARVTLGAFLGASPDDLAFISNATTGVNTVLRSLRFEPGDELLTTNHDYNACRNALAFVAERSGAKVVVANVPFPVRDADEIVRAIVSSVTPRTKLALIDHVTSATALVFPIARVVRELEARGVDTLVDGAHAPGMLPLELDGIGAAYYTGNFHKWLCAPKGAAFLHVRRDRQDRVRPLTISHGANATRTNRSRFRSEFDWLGTVDPTAHLAAAACPAELGALLEGGFEAVYARNHAMAIAARARVAERLGLELPAPDALLGAMATLVLPGDAPRDAIPGADPLQGWLEREHAVLPVVFAWGAPRRRLLRLSAQIYNTIEEYERLAAALAGAAKAGMLG